MSIKWAPVLEAGVAIVEGYDTQVTLRQLFYRLVAVGLVPNTTTAYKNLSRQTALARRDGVFPSLADNTRSIVQAASWGSVREALDALVGQYRRDRTEGQRYQVWIGVEKSTMTAQLSAWFGQYGVPVVALRGYTSQSFAAVVEEAVNADGREAVLVYAGDHDASGEDIDRDFEAQTNGCFDRFERIAVTPEQVEQYALPPQPGKSTDSRAAGFLARHGRLIQVELEALDPEVLHALYEVAFEKYLDRDVLDELLAVESEEREELTKR